MFTEPFAYFLAMVTAAVFGMLHVCVAFKLPMHFEAWQPKLQRVFDHAAACCTIVRCMFCVRTRIVSMNLV